MLGRQRCIQPLKDLQLRLPLPGRAMSRCGGRALSTCYFRCSYQVAELGRHLPEVDELEFRFDKPRPSVVRLSKSYWDRQPADAQSAICAAETTGETNDEKMSSEFISGILDELYVSVMIPTVAIFRWRCGLAEGSSKPGRNVKGYCSNDGKSWSEVSMIRGLRFSFGIPTGPYPRWTCCAMR